MTTTGTIDGHLQHGQLLEAARARGIAITDVTDIVGRKAALLELDGHVELLVKGVLFSSMQLATKALCDYKQLSKLVFARVGIPSPRSRLFSTPDDPGLEAFFAPGKTYVCKPQLGFNGNGVRMGITTFDEVRQYWSSQADPDMTYLLEEQIEGTDLRLQIIGGRIAAACVRVPAHVIGDGDSTLQALVERRRAVIHGQNPANRLDLGETELELVASQGLTLASVPEAGRQVWLKRVSNMGQGGHAIDYTEEIHPRYHEWTKRVVEHIDASFMAIDFICEDPTIDPEGTAHVLEINALAEWAHHTFSERRTHDLAGLVIDQAFGL